VPEQVASRSYERTLSQRWGIKTLAMAVAPSKITAQEEVDDEEEYEVEAILSEKNGKFLVKWKGYAESEATWEAAALCSGCPQLDR
jgi:hypothetical protein